MATMAPTKAPCAKRKGHQQTAVSTRPGCMTTRWLFCEARRRKHVVAWPKMAAAGVASNRAAWQHRLASCPHLRRAGADQLGPQPRQHGKQGRLQQAAQQRHIPDLLAGSGKNSRAVRGQVSGRWSGPWDAGW